MANKQIVVGITGRFGSGCTTTLNWLKTKHFNTFALGDFVKKQARKKNKAIDKQTEKWKRRILQDTGDKIRKDKGDDYLVKQVLSGNKGIGMGDIAIGGIRHPAEVVFLQNQFKQNLFYGKPT